jgi:putative ABC transport system permease protein
MDEIARRLAAVYPEANANRGAAVTPILEDVLGDLSSRLYLLFAAVGMVLLIACVNVANLLLARVNRRQKEIAIRSAMGAGRGRIARQFVIESIVLGISGGICGLGIAVIGTSSLVAASPAGLLRREVGFDWHVMMFAVALSFLTAIVFALAPILQALRTDAQTLLREAGMNFQLGFLDIQKVLVIGEVA